MDKLPQGGWTYSCMARHGQQKFITCHRDEIHNQLFDVIADPDETTNLADASRTKPPPLPQLPPAEWVFPPLKRCKNAMLLPLLCWPKRKLRPAVMTVSATAIIPAPPRKPRNTA